MMGVHTSHALKVLPDIAICGTISLWSKQLLLDSDGPAAYNIV